MAQLGNTVINGSLRVVGDVYGISYYGTCSTASGTAAKVATVQNLNTLSHGVTIHVYFSSYNSASNPTLNVNSTGAKKIYRYGTTSIGATGATSWAAGQTVSFVYDSTGDSNNGAWRMSDCNDNMIQRLYATSSTGTSASSQSTGNVYLNLIDYAGSTISNSVHLSPGFSSRIFCSGSGSSGDVTFDSYPTILIETASGTQGKIADCYGYTLLSDSYILVILQNANSYNGQIGLSIAYSYTSGAKNYTAAKPIYINGTVSSSSNKTLPAGAYLVYYDGANFYFRTDGEITCPDNITQTEVNNLF